MATNRYHNGKIYVIRSPSTEDIYIGSTCLPLHKRLYSHNASGKGYLKGTTNYRTSYEVIKFNDAYIELVAEYPCETKYQLEAEEGKYIRGSDCINKHLKCDPEKYQSLRTSRLKHINTYKKYQSAYHKKKRAERKAAAQIQGVDQE